MKKPHRFVLLASLLMLGMIVSPVCAASYTITAEPLGGELHGSLAKVTNYTFDASPEGNAIQRISIDLVSGAAINYTLWYGDGSTVDGWMEYSNTGLFTQHSAVSIGTDISGYSYWGLQEIGRIDIIGYARNYTSDTEFTQGFIVYDSVFGVSERKAMAYYEVENPSDLVIYKFSMTSSKPVALGYYTNTRANVARAATVTPVEAVDDWITLAYQFAGSVKDFVISVFYTLKFFFVDNLLLIIALWISVTMAVSATQSRNIFQFYQKFFRYQRSLMDFIFSLFRFLVEIVNTMKQIFFKWI